MNLNGFAYIKDTSIGLSGKSDMAICYLYVYVFFLKQEKHFNASIISNETFLNFTLKKFTWDLVTKL